MEVTGKARNVKAKVQINETGEYEQAQATREIETIEETTEVKIKI